MKRQITVYSLIALAALLYGVGTVLFIFPNSVLLGGTSGIALIVAKWLPVSPGTVSVILNTTLIVLAFVILGKGVALRTFVGSALTTVFIGVFEPLFANVTPLVSNNYLAAFIGAAIIALASGIMFYVDSSSGGTDIVALILKKYVDVNIGRALFITDVLIVIVGGIVSGVWIAIASVIGFLVKVLGIDAVIYVIRRLVLKAHKKSESSKQTTAENRQKA